MRRSAVANCELAEASTLIRPPARPRLEIRSGGLPWSLSMSAPAARNASRSGAIGRRRRGSSPSRTTVPFASSATAARKRSVVPESPAFTFVPPATGRPEVPVTSVSPPTSSIRAPRIRSPEVIASVSSLSSRRLSTLLPSAKAAMTSRRLVKLLDDGTSSLPPTGPAGTSSRTARESQSCRAGPATGQA